MNEVKPLKGQLLLPGDKSISHRSAMFSVLATGKSIVENVSDGGDVSSTISVLKTLGANITLEGTTLTTNGTGLVSLSGDNINLDCGNSGTSFRLFCGLLSGQNVNNVSLIGDESLSKRPQDRVVIPLQSIGVNIQSNNGLAPVTISSSVPHSQTLVSKVASAQVKSAVLLAGLYADGPVTNIEKTLTREHTENMLSQMGVKIEKSNTEQGHVATIIPPRAPLSPLNGTVPADPSSAAFFGISAVIIPGSDLTIMNMLGSDTRIGWLKVLERMGANIEILEKEEVFGEKTIDVRIQYSKLSAVEISGEEISSMVDELPMLSIAMSRAQGTSRVRDASELRVKESDRITVVLEHLNQLGINTVEYEDGYDITGTDISLKRCEINAHHDHRIAMTFIIANYLADGALTKSNLDIISTSFPSFFNLFEQVIS